MLLTSTPIFLSVLLTVCLSALLICKAHLLKLVDAPGERKVHALPTPRTGGLAMVAGGGLSLLALGALNVVPWPHLPWQTWSAGVGFLTVGALDDRFTFQPRQKFLVLLGLSALAAAPWIMALPGAGLPLGPAAMAPAALLVFWFMAVPNAVNIEDAINGYMGGYTLIVLIALAIQGQDHRIALGALAGFLVLNWPTARHFLGDAGSFGCGFYLAEAALRCGGLDHPWVPLVLTAPISMDVAMGLYRRHRLGMTFFTPDRLTCPHHVLDRVGGNIRLATPILWLNTSLFAVAAWSPALALAPVLAYAVILIHFNRSFLSMGTE